MRLLQLLLGEFRVPDPPAAAAAAAGLLLLLLLFSLLAPGATPWLLLLLRRRSSTLGKSLLDQMRDHTKATCRREKGGQHDIDHLK
jgi:hypothetical protein